MHARSDISPEAISEVALRPPQSFFLSAAWMQACAESWRGKADFRMLQSTGAPLVWALLGERTVWRHRILPARVLALNQSAVSQLDQAWIERNGFFGGTAPRFSDDLAELLDHLQNETAWDELRLSGLMREQANAALALAGSRGLTGRVEFDAPVHWVDLQRVRERHSGDYLAALSANTRQQLRRARRFAEREFGALRIDEAGSRDEALDWFARTAPLHRTRWAAATAPGGRSGFDNPEFVAFHQRLIRLSFDRGGIQYLRLSAGSTIVAYLYNLVTAGTVHFYLSGIDYGLADSLRPGILAHWMAIDRNLVAGRQVYDFLAGDAQYKRNLATDSDRMSWLVLQRPRWKLRAEDLARRVWRLARPRERVAAIQSRLIGAR